MASNKPLEDIVDPVDLPENEGDLENAIDSLRGVLKQDAEGTMRETADFGGLDMDFPAAGGFGAEDFGQEESLDFAAPGAGSMAMEDFSAASPSVGSALNANLDLIMDIPIDVQIVLGNSRMQVSGLMNLAEGAIIPLDKKIGEPVEIMINGRRIARGEITVLENDDTRFGVKLIEVMKTTKA